MYKDKVDKLDQKINELNDTQKANLNKEIEDLESRLEESLRERENQLSELTGKVDGIERSYDERFK